MKLECCYIVLFTEQVGEELNNMRYVINFARYTGINLIDTFFYGAYDNEEEYRHNLAVLYDTFVALGKYKEVLQNNSDDFKISYIVLNKDY